MIQLDAQYTTAVQTLSGGEVVSSVVTDTLYVKEVHLDFSTGTLSAHIERGAIVNGSFCANYAPLDITVNPDGTFSSSDRAWNGSAPSLPAVIAQLKATFDQLLLGTGSVTGQAI